MWVGWLSLIHLYRVIYRPSAIKMVSMLCLSQYKSIRSLRNSTPTCNVKILLFYAYLFMIQIYFHPENRPQISCCSREVQMSFPFLFHIWEVLNQKQKYCLILVSCQPRANFGIQLHYLTSCSAASQLGLPTITYLLYDVYKNLIFHINPNQTAV